MSLFNQERLIIEPLLKACNHVVVITSNLSETPWNSGYFVKRTYVLPGLKSQASMVEPVVLLGADEVWNTTTHLRNALQEAGQNIAHVVYTGYKPPSAVSDNSPSISRNIPGK